MIIEERAELTTEEQTTDPVTDQGTTDLLIGIEGLPEEVEKTIVKIDGLPVEGEKIIADEETNLWTVGNGRLGKQIME
jgi:hypothetical protein